MKPKIYGIIPARKNSKRIPNKNKRLFNGKPLVVWTIEEAKKSSYISTIILSSDDQEILEMGYINDIETHIQGEDSTGDNTPFLPTAIRIMNKYHAKPEDLIVLLQPTAPLRDSKDIDAGILMFQMYHAHSLISAYINQKAGLAITLDDGWVVPVMYKKYLTGLTHNIPEFLIPNGALYIIPFKFLELYKSWYTPMTKVYVMLDYKSVDVDNEFEWMVAEFIHRVLKKNGGKLK